MARIRQMEAQLQADAPGLNPEAYRQRQAAIDAAKKEARQLTDQTAKRSYERITDRRADVQRGLAETRDDLQKLAKEVKLGRISGAEAIQRLEALEGQRTALASQRSFIANAVEAINDVELGPVDEFGDRPEQWEPEDYYDAQVERFPAMSQLRRPVLGSEE